MDDITPTAKDDIVNLQLLIPQTLSSVFDTSFDLYKRYFRFFVLSVAILFFPSQIVLYGIDNVWLRPLQVHLQTPAGDTDTGGILLFILGKLAIGAPAYGLPGLFSLAMWILAGGPVCVLASQCYTSDRLSIRTAYRQAFPAIPRMLAGYLLAGLGFCGIAMIGALLFVTAIAVLLILLASQMPPVLMTALSITFVILNYIACMALIARYFLFVTPLTVLEKLSIINMFDRSEKLAVKSGFRRTWAAATFLPLVTFGLQYLILLSIGTTLSSLHLAPPIEFLTGASLTALIVLFFQPYAMIFLTVLYHDARIRCEGFDLFLLSLKLAESPISQTSFKRTAESTIASTSVSTMTQETVSLVREGQ